MAGRPIDPDFQHLDITVSPSFLGLYTQLCLAYSVPDPSQHENIIQRLKAGLDRLSAAFPWIAGQVIKNGSAVKMQPLAQTPELVVKDYTDNPSFPSMADYVAAGFPFRMLDENLICPVNTLPGQFAQGSAPILFVQINFIRGGLLLTFTAEHTTMDMTGQAQTIALLDKICKGQDLSEQELKDGNTDRRNVIRLIDDYQRGSELDWQIKKTGPHVTKASGGEDEVSTNASTEYVWGYWTFSNDALKSLKDLAMKSLSSGYVSTDDTICAFIWQLVSRARRSRYPTGTKTTFARAIDARRFLNVPATYIGLLNNMTYHQYTLDEIARMPLGVIAADFRKAVDPATTQLEYNTRAFATAISQAEDKTVFSPVANIEPDKDISLSSWANINSYQLDFGFGVGKPVSVRRPRLGPVESLMYIMPRDAKGNSAVAVCLREEDMNAVTADPDFVKYAAYIG